MIDGLRTGRDSVLVVDDTPESLGFVTEMLDQAGMTVLIATDGESALRLVSRITPDLVLMDAMMPGLDGFEACRRMKRMPVAAHLPVIFMTGLSDTENVVRGLAAGGVDYVAKPIVAEELLARIRVHLSNARNVQGPRAALDAAGRFLLATDRAGQVRWCTPKARQLLMEVFPPNAGDEICLPKSLIQQLMSLRSSGRSGEATCALNTDTRKLEFTILAPIGADELLFRLHEVDAAGSEGRLKDSLGLTAREAAVLLWLSRGKSNREIGAILSISPRTVNKHLEQVFVKLGVENRASAVARAVRLLSQ